MLGPDRPKKIPVKRSNFGAIFPFSFSPLSPPEKENKKICKKDNKTNN